MKRYAKISVCLVLLVGLFVNISFAAELKNVIVLYLPSTEAIAQRAVQALEQAGFVDQENIALVQLPIASEEQAIEAAAQIQAASPDVVLCFIGFYAKFITNEVRSVPIIMNPEVENYVDADGVPTANVTGVYAQGTDIMYNSYKFLQKIAPLKAGQQVVFLSNSKSGLLTEEEAVDALQRLQIPIKAVVDATVLEDWKQAILKYNDDPEVGWILEGAGPMIKQDGSYLNRYKEALPWQREHLKKPGITYFERRVQSGALCGFASDLFVSGVQSGELAARLLQGEDVRTIQAVYPRKVSIALNRKTATNLGIVFSMDVLKLADVIYDDYEGKQVIRK